MTASDVQALVFAAIGDDWNETNSHGIDLRACLIKPRRMQVIWRMAGEARSALETREVWLVLEERSVTKNGRMIVFDEKRKVFGLASPGHGSDEHPSLDGYHGDFWTTFKEM